MPVIENIKNFIRHGKQARHFADTAEDDQNIRTKHSLSESADTRRDRAFDKPAQPQAPIPAVTPANDKKTPGGGGDGFASGMANQKYDENLLARLIAEEKENKGKLPKYPGLDRFKLIEKMGDGAFSNVYRALDLEGEHEEVAIKVVRKYELNASQNDHLHPDFKKQPKTVERANILKEVQIMRGLNHPNIVKLISFSECRSYYYIVLELLKGGELFHQIVRLTYFSEELSRHVIVPVAEALKYLHEEKGVVHRDIKPENLLFEPIPFVPSKHPRQLQPGDEEKADEGEFIKGVGSGGIGRIKVADFGLSKVVWDNNTMTPCGTVGYTAPEIVRDERYSKSVDMWALGCVLYTLLCGFPPFYDESIQVLTEKVAKGQYTFLSPWWDNISKSAQDLVSHLLTVDPKKRYTIEQFMNHPWILESEEPTTSAPDAPPIAAPTPKGESMPTPMMIDDPTPYAAGTTKRMDFRSPGAVSLREVFDVGYAVHRMEEEGKRRKRIPGGAAAGVTSLNAMDEDEEYEYSPSEEEGQEGEDGEGDKGMRDVEGRLRKAKLNATGKEGREIRRVVGGAGRRRDPGQFELSLDGATLLGRRRGGVVGE